MLKSLRRLASRKGETSRRSSRSRQGCLTLERLGERILLAAGTSLAANGLVPISSNYDDPFARAAHVEWMDLADFDCHGASVPTRLSGPRVLIRDTPVIYRKDP